MYKKTDIVLMHDKQRIGRLMPTKDNIVCCCLVLSLPLAPYHDITSSYGRLTIL